MKRKILVMVLSILVAISFLASPKQITYAADLSDNPIIILSGKINEDGNISIDANLTNNPGISGMTLELSYNTNVMTLVDVKFGEALASLEPLHTNVEKTGYSVTPFKFNYLGKENDFSTGKLFTLKFELKDNIKDGKYRVSLKYTRDQDVNYIDNHGELRTKNLFIDNAEVEIKGDLVIHITSVRDEEKSNTWIVILCVSLGVLAVGTTVAAIIIVKKRRNWKRL